MDNVHNELRFLWEPGGRVEGDGAIGFLFFFSRFAAQNGPPWWQVPMSADSRLRSQRTIQSDSDRLPLGGAAVTDRCCSCAVRITVRLN